MVFIWLLVLDLLEYHVMVISVNGSIRAKLLIYLLLQADQNKLFQIDFSNGGHRQSFLVIIIGRVHSFDLQSPILPDIRFPLALAFVFLAHLLFTFI